jgi:dihydroorotase
MQITLTRPDDWHLHVRDGAALAAVLPHTAQEMGRAVMMPNLKPPVDNTAAALAYRQRIMAALPPNSQFEPLMTLYLTPNLSPDEIIKAKQAGIVAVKLYPAGATTNSEAGIKSLEASLPTLQTMAEVGLPLLVHGEVTDADIDIFDREAVFIERVLRPLMAQLPTLKIVLEHITTREAVDFVMTAPDTVAATITAHHLLMNRNAIFTGGIRPHHYCLPVLKREQHRLALLSAASSGSPKFFLGTDSAPHAQHTKEAACGCAGIYTAFAALPLYAMAFESVQALDKLEGFASHFGPDFYGLPRNTSHITLLKKEWQVPASYPYVDGADIVPLYAGETLSWQVLA